MDVDLTNLQNLDKFGWVNTKNLDFYKKGEVYIESINRKIYENEEDGRTLSLVVNYHLNTPFFMGWGYKDEEDCRYHSVFMNGSWQKPQSGCPDFKYFKNTSGKDCISINYQNKTLTVNERLLIVSDYNRFTNCIKVYKPLIVIFLLSFFISFLFGKDLMSFMNFFMGAFMGAISLFKFKDIPSFASSFKEYDPLAQKFNIYGYTYPHIEMLVAVSFLVGVFTKLSSFIVVFIYSVTTIGIIKAIRQNKKLKCACLGSSFDLPLSYVTVIENTIMIIMAILMLTIM